MITKTETKTTNTVAKESKGKGKKSPVVCTTTTTTTGTLAKQSVITYTFSALKKMHCGIRKLAESGEEPNEALDHGFGELVRGWLELFGHPQPEEAEEQQFFDGLFNLTPSAFTAWCFGVVQMGYAELNRDPVAFMAKYEAKPA